MSPAGVGTSPSIIQQALPSPIQPMSPYASWASPGDDDDPLERFVDALTPGVRTSRRSPVVNNTPPAGVGTPLRTSTPVPTNVVGVGAMTLTTLPRRLTAAERGKGPTVAHKQPRRKPRQNTPSTPVMPEVEDEAVPATPVVMRVVEVAVVVEAVVVAEMVAVVVVVVGTTTTMTMETRRLRPWRDPSGVDDVDEPIKFSTMPRCNNNWPKSYKINAKRPQVDALQVSRPATRSRRPTKTDNDPP